MLYTIFNHTHLKVEGTPQFLGLLTNVDRYLNRLHMGPQTVY